MSEPEIAQQICTIISTVCVVTLHVEIRLLSVLSVLSVLAYKAVLTWIRILFVIDINPLAPELFFFLILAHPVYKM